MVFRKKKITGQHNADLVAFLSKDLIKRFNEESVYIKRISYKDTTFSK